LDTTGTVNNLVILIEFSDHTSRALPNLTALTDLMNTPGGSAAFAPTGSVYDVYMESSYNQLEIISYIAPWYTCSITESQAAGTDSGTGSDARLEECIHDALDAADALYDFSSLFDENSDGAVDAIAILHSGYVDCASQTFGQWLPLIVHRVRLSGCFSVCDPPFASGVQVCRRKHRQRLLWHLECEPNLEPPGLPG